MRRDRQPAVPEIGVIALVPDRWGGLWMPRHQILTRLGRYFNVVWLDPAREWREWWLPSGRPREPVAALDAEFPGFRIYRPGRWLPRVYRPLILAAVTDHVRMRRARRLLRARGARRVILYLWRPEFAGALDRLPHDLSCYHIDDEYSFSPVERPLDKGEKRLIQRVDQVIIHSPALAEKKGHLNRHTRVVPNGVDYPAFAMRAEEPSDLKRVPHPRIGYVGVVKRQLDLSLLAVLAERHPGWAFVFVGPIRVPATDPVMRALTGRSNVYFLGGKPVNRLAAYMQSMDVCIMPYVLDDYTKYIYPLKLHEYLATGRPVVGSPIRSLREFEQVVRLARTPEQWSAALGASLGPEAMADDAVERRRAVAREHDWDRLACEIAWSLAAHLGPRYAAALDRGPIR